MAIVQRKDAFTSLSIQQEYYSDFFDNFDIHPVKKDLVRHTNEDAVKTSIRNLLMTNRGDKIYNGNIGSDIRGLLFENASLANQSVLVDIIKNTISNYEPRAKVIDVFVDSSIDEHSLTATIVFSIINKEEPITLELIINRIR